MSDHPADRVTDQPNPVFQTTGEILLTGRMAIYNSQAEASYGIPLQWRSFLSDHPALSSNSNLYGASPCTSDRSIHYLAGVPQKSPDTLPGSE